MRSFIEELDEKGRLIRIDKEVDPKFEIASILKRLDGNAVYFSKVKGYKMPIVGGLCSSRELISTGLGTTPDKLVIKLADAIDHPTKPKTAKTAPCQEVVEDDVSKIPFLTHYSRDKTPYITSSVVIAKDPEYGQNMSIHRIMVIDPKHLIIRICERDLHEYLKRAGGELDVAIAIGTSMSVLVAEAMRVPIKQDELEIANTLDKVELVRAKTVDVDVPADAEIIIEGRITKKMGVEGPFVELTGKYDSIERQQPIIDIKKVTRRKDSIYQALVGGSNEHKLLMGLPREPTIYNEVKKVCDCKNVSITPGGASWLHAVVQIRKKNADDGRKAIDAAFKGHSSVKHVWVVDDDVDPFNPLDVEWSMATRFQGGKNLVMFEDSKGSSIDPSSEYLEGCDRKKTTKMGFDCTIPSDRKREDFLRVEAPMKIDPKKYGINL
ncbi:MAG: UbiD family decarboxylase [Candidatus Altiarchaeota archaeon]